MDYNIQYEPIQVKYVPAASDLVLSLYKEQLAVSPFLPYEEKFLGYFHHVIDQLFQKGKGIVAICNNKLVGFLAGVEVPELWGKYKAIYCPVYGHGVIKDHRSNLYQELYKHAADLWVKNGCLTHAITFFANDKKTIDTWFWQGFGLRCVDAIRRVEPIYTNNSAIIIKKVGVKHIPVLADIHRQHNQYYKSSPIFMPRKEEDPIQDLTEWLEHDNHHLWVAYHGKKPVGYMRIQPNGERFVSEHPNVMNITGAYILKNERRSGIGVALLATIQRWLIQNGYPLCAVDFESINTMGSNFWTKYFSPYTYTMVRRIDERIC